MNANCAAGTADQSSRPALSPPHLFRSFWMGGFESATHINALGERVDMLAGVQHDVQAESDYALLRSVGMRAARDAVRWHLIDRGGHYDFSSFEPMLTAALRQNVQVIWDICHYGWPDDVDLFTPQFVDRFARFAGATARFVREHSDEIPFYAPINEISFLCWGASRDLIFPYAHGRDDEIKRQLIRACIAGCEAVWKVDPRARFVYPEPVVHVMAPRGMPALIPRAEQHREAEFEAWDMLCGRKSPELGGHPKYLDILGANYYHSNQWEIEGNGRLRWEDHPRDDRWRPFEDILAEVYRRYARPLFVAETSHFGIGRALWIQEIAQSVYTARLRGTPVEAICLYPILDRYDWQDAEHWHNSGLWDLQRNGSGTLDRVLNRAYAHQLIDSQARLAQIGCI